MTENKLSSQTEDNNNKKANRLFLNIANCRLFKPISNNDNPYKFELQIPTAVNAFPERIHNKYKNLKNVIAPNTNYYIVCEDNDQGHHGKHHCENLSEFENVYVGLRDVKDFL